MGHLEDWDVFSDEDTLLGVGFAGERELLLQGAPGPIQFRIQKLELELCVCWVSELPVLSLEVCPCCPYVPLLPKGPMESWAA